MVENVKNWRLSKIADEHGLEDLERYTLPISVNAFAMEEGVSEETILAYCVEHNEFGEKMAAAARVMAKNLFVHAAYISDGQSTGWPSEKKVAQIAKAISEMPGDRKSRTELIQEKIQAIADEHQITEDYLIYAMREVLVFLEQKNGIDELKHLEAIFENPNLGATLVEAARELATNGEMLESYLKDRLAAIKSS